MNLSQTRGGQTSSSEVESVQIKLRIKPALRSSLEEAAKINGVSLSQEIVCRLYRTFAVEETESKIEQVMQEFGEKMNKMTDKIDAIITENGFTYSIESKRTKQRS